MDLNLLDPYATGFLLRWAHLVTGTLWLGLLYAAWLAGAALHRRLRGWILLGAAGSTLTGLGLFAFHRLAGLGITLGAVLGGLMLVNTLWSAAGRASPTPWVASSVLLSVPMLFFMASSRHLPALQSMPQLANPAALAGLAVVVTGAWLGAGRNRLGPLGSAPWMAVCAAILSASLYLLVELA